MVDVKLAVLLLAAGGCYAPDLRDCVVACTSSAECAAAHVCGSDGFCATAERAGHCGMLHDGGDDIDARLDPDARMPADARMADAAGPHVTLTIDVGGKGSVDVGTLGNCSPPPMCTYSVPTGVAIHLVARPAADQRFDKWDGVCDQQMATCTVIPLMDGHATAHFKKED
jgi:hypothetical protein